MGKWGIILIYLYFNIWGHVYLLLRARAPSLIYPSSIFAHNLAEIPSLRAATFFCVFFSWIFVPLIDFRLQPGTSWAMGKWIGGLSGGDDHNNRGRRRA
jgi:hypothetical protein